MMNDTTLLIGRVCVYFENLSLTLSEIVGSLISEDPYIGAIVTSEMSFKNLVNAFSSLMKYKYSSEAILQKEADDLVRFCNTAEEKRNMIIHSGYFMTEAEFIKQDSELVTPNIRLKINAKQKHGLKAQITDVSIQDLMEICDQILVPLHTIDTLYFTLFKRPLNIIS